MGSDWELNTRQTTGELLKVFIDIPCPANRGGTSTSPLSQSPLNNHGVELGFVGGTMKHPRVKVVLVGTNNV